MHKPPTFDPEKIRKGAAVVQKLIDSATAEANVEVRRLRAELEQARAALRRVEAERDALQDSVMELLVLLESPKVEHKLGIDVTRRYPHPATDAVRRARALLAHPQSHTSPGDAPEGE